MSWAREESSVCKPLKIQVKIMDFELEFLNSNLKSTYDLWSLPYMACELV